MPWTATGPPSPSLAPVGRGRPPRLGIGDSRVKDSPLLQRHGYHFFGRTLLVETEAPDVDVALNAVYGRMRLASPPAEAEADLVMRVHAGDGHLAGTRPSRIEVAGRTIRVPEPEQLAHYAHLVMLNATAALVDDAVVLHAGAVTRGGKAMVLLGHSGLGKTTLTVELVRRGWGFLSDDFAVMDDRAIVHPFPRRVNLTDASLALLALDAPVGALRMAGFRAGEKTMIDIEDIVPGSLADGAPLGALVVLGAPPLPADGGEDVVWQLELDHRPAGFTAALAALPCVSTVRAPAGSGGDGALEVVAATGSAFVRALDELCAQADVAVLSARRGAMAGAATRHLGPATVEPLDTGDALAEVLAYALSLAGARFFGRSSDREILSALAVLRAALRPPVRVVRVRPGALVPTADALEALL